MKTNALCFLGLSLLVAAAGAAEVEILSYSGGNLDFTVRGSGTVTVTAQADVRYLSATTGADAMVRAVTNPLKISLSESVIPVKINFNPPDGSVTEVEVIVFIDGVEKARRTFYF